MEIDLVEGHNARLIDLFDKRHARRVLTKFGQGYGCVNTEKPTAQEVEFIDAAVDQLAENDRVISVRLALFAEMFRDKPWNTNSLRRAGGVSGVGVAFLEDVFCSRNSRPEHRLHEDAARKILAALLPDSNIDIRGNMQSRSELAHQSGYTNRPQAFADVLRVLDNDLRLISPTNPDGNIQDQDSQTASEHRYYRCSDAV